MQEKEAEKKEVVLKIRLPRETIEKVLVRLFASKRIQRAWRRHKEAWDTVRAELLAVDNFLESNKEEGYDDSVSMAPTVSKVLKRAYLKLLIVAPPAAVDDEDKEEIGKKLYSAFLVEVFPKHVFVLNFGRLERRLQAAARELCGLMRRSAQRRVRAPELPASFRAFAELLEAWDSNRGPRLLTTAMNDIDEVPPRDQEVVASLVAVHKGPAKVLQLLDKGSLCSALFDGSGAEHAAAAADLGKVLHRVFVVAKWYYRMDEDTERALEALIQRPLSIPPGLNRDRQLDAVMSLIGKTCPRLEYFAAKWEKKQVDGDKKLQFLDQYSRSLWLYQYASRLTGKDEEEMEVRVASLYAARVASSSDVMLQLWAGKEVQRVSGMGPFFPKQIPLVYVVASTGFVRAFVMSDETLMPEAVRPAYETHKDYFARLTSAVVDKLAVLVVSFQGKQEGILSFKEFARVFKEEVTRGVTTNVDKRLKKRMEHILGESSGMRRILTKRWSDYLLHRVVMTKFEGKRDERRYRLVDEIMVKMGSLVDEGVDLLVRIVDLHVAVHGATYCGIMCPTPKLL